MRLLHQLLDDAWRLLTLKQRPPFDYGYTVVTLSLVLFALGMITADPGPHFTAPLVVRLGFYGVQYLLSTFLFAWILSSTLGRRGHALPLLVAYTLITLLSLPDLAVPALRLLDEDVLGLYSLVVLCYTLFVLYRTLQESLKVPAVDLLTCIALALLGTLMMAQAYDIAAIATGLVDPNDIPLK